MCISRHCLQTLFVFLFDTAGLRKKTLTSQRSHCTQPTYTRIRQRRALSALFNTFASNTSRYTCKYDRCLADNKRRRGDDTSCRKRAATCIICCRQGSCDFRDGSQFCLLQKSGTRGRKSRWIRLGFNAEIKAQLCRQTTGFPMSLSIQLWFGAHHVNKSSFKWPFVIENS